MENFPAPTTMTAPKTSSSSTESFERAGKSIGFVCHAPGALRHVPAADGAPLTRAAE